MFRKGNEKVVVNDEKVDESVIVMGKRQRQLLVKWEKWTKEQLY